MSRIYLMNRTQTCVYIYIYRDMPYMLTRGRVNGHVEEASIYTYLYLFKVSSSLIQVIIISAGHTHSPRSYENMEFT